MWLVRAGHLGLLLMLGLLPVVNISSWIDHDKVATATKPAEVPTQTDFAIFNAVLETIQTNKDFKEVWNKVRLVDQTATVEFINFGFMGDHSTTWQGHKAPNIAVTDAKRRGKQAVSLAQYKPKPAIEFITTAEVDEFHKQETEAFNTRQVNHSFFKYPLIIRIALPGFTKNKKEAFLAYDYDDGGGYSGGTGVAYLRKHNKDWQVMWIETYRRIF